MGCLWVRPEPAAPAPAAAPVQGVTPWGPMPPFEVRTAASTPSGSLHRQPSPGLVPSDLPLWPHWSSDRFPGIRTRWDS